MVTSFSGTLILAPSSAGIIAPPLSYFVNVLTKGSSLIPPLMCCCLVTKEAPSQLRTYHWDFHSSSTIMFLIGWAAIDAWPRLSRRTQPHLLFPTGVWANVPPAHYFWKWIHLQKAIWKGQWRIILDNCDKSHHTYLLLLCRFGAISVFSKKSAIGYGLKSSGSLAESQCYKFL